MNDIQKLIDKYMDGLTTRDEEDQLRRYFTSPESIIPADLEWMRALMEWEDTPHPVTRRKHAAVQMLRIAATPFFLICDSGNYFTRTLRPLTMLIPF